MSTQHHGRNDIDAVLIQLQAVMTREVAVMREMLSNLQEEQQAILHSNTEALNRVLRDREPLMDIVLECRSRRNDIMKQVAKLEGLSTPLDGDLSAATLDILYGYGSNESSAVLSLRDQILALIEAMRDQTNRNNYLIQSKVSLTKEMIRRLYPGSDSNTYGQDGTVGKKRCAVAIINKEG